MEQHMKIIAAILGSLLICYFAVSVGLLPFIAGLLTTYKGCTDSAASTTPRATDRDYEKRVTAGCAGVVATGAIVEKAAVSKH
jgi:hypothetical protein